VSIFRAVTKDAQIVTETSLFDREAEGTVCFMLCAQCRRDTPSVQQREEFCPAFLCDDCYEYEKIHNVLKLTTERGESDRLYDKLCEMGKRIEELRREYEREAREMKRNPLFGKHSPENSAE
jgi:hypothetical protein